MPDPHADPSPGPAPIDRARAIAKSVRDAGGRALVVGGFVRDRLLGLESKDVDLEVYGLAAADLRRILAGFGRVDEVGGSFTVYKVGDLDIALPRRESKVGPGHRGFEVTGDPFMTVEAAARRRDFTINAIAWDPLSGERLDPFGGEADLRARRLRLVDRRTFADDSLRVLRAVQLAARFELEADDEVKAVCRLVGLDDLPAERIWGEVEKLLLLARRPSIGLALALEIGVVDRLFPQLSATVGCRQEPEWHPEGDVWTHTLLVVDNAVGEAAGLARGPRTALMLGALCHDLGKPATTAFFDGRIRSHNHEEAGVGPAMAMLDRLNVNAIDGYDARRQVAGLVAHHLKPGSWHKVGDEVGDGAFRRLAQKVDLELLARLARADCLGRPGPFDCGASDWFVERARALGVEHRPPSPLLLGRHVVALGVRPGPRVGEILRAVYELQLDGRITSEAEAREEASRILAREGGCWSG